MERLENTKGDIRHRHEKEVTLKQSYKVERYNAKESRLVIYIPARRSPLPQHDRGCDHQAHEVFHDKIHILDTSKTYGTQTYLIQLTASSSDDDVRRPKTLTS
eukprot:656496-Amphidinium_carterae.1